MANLSMMLAVAAGGAIGAVARYMVSLVAGAELFGISGPLATLSVNIAGSLMMGLFAGWVATAGPISELWRGFLAVGCLGALTTFSSFALDAGTLLQKQGLLAAGGYVLLSVGLSLLAFGAGFWLLRQGGA